MPHPTHSLWDAEGDGEEMGDGEETARLLEVATSEDEKALVDNDSSMKQPMQDIVQLSSPIYFVEETDKKISLEVMRLGLLKGSCSIKYRTVDGQMAKEGVRFRGAIGELVFLDGEDS